MTATAALLISAHALATAGLLFTLWRAVRSDERAPGTPVWAAAVGLLAAGLLAIDLAVIPLGVTYRGPVQYHPHGFGATVFRWRTTGFGMTLLAVPVCGVAAVIALFARLGDRASRGADGWDATVAWVVAGALAGLQFFVWVFTGAFPTV